MHRPTHNILLSSPLLYKSLRIKVRKTKSVHLPVVLYGCETWSLTLREEHRPRVFKNSVLWSIQHILAVCGGYILEKLREQ
jgi:hypothetical protein